MAQIMVGESHRANANAMIDELAKERGSYFANLVEAFGARAEPNLNPKTVQLIADKIRQLEFGPQLVIGNIVENTFGGEEAARYVIALATGKAR